MANLRTKNNKKALQAAFLLQLEATGNITMSCKKSKVPRRTIYDWLEKDVAFKEAYDKSVQIGIDMLEDEAQRRAYHGTTKPIFQNGKLVGKVQEFSDTLLIFLLKGKKPEVYKDRTEHSGTIDGSTTIRIGYGTKEED
ncbi:hypothetical protein J3L18_00055 [Mucilaginibacter gossypii]|uniref:terminase n=1 Tax=Mucilaginibacter gossypii TaxID=551996 RepID=UPI000DCC1CA3|nr:MULTISPECIES: terminase [Mucilaginibacter]QTE37495.1 hypothetical protein J3L18_00055 [Mucilaginibacter gossypii]RAV52320.1 terminase [Mucilaginibacter rubeus]